MKTKFIIPGTRKGGNVQVQAMRCRHFDLTRPSDAPKMTLQSMRSCSDPPSASPPKHLPQQPLKHLIQRMLVRCSARDQKCICSACLFPRASALRALQLHSFAPSMQSFKGTLQAGARLPGLQVRCRQRCQLSSQPLLRSAQLWVRPQ